MFAIGPREPVSNVSTELSLCSVTSGEVLKHSLPQFPLLKIKVKKE